MPFSPSLHLTQNPLSIRTNALCRRRRRRRKELALPSSQKMSLPSCFPHATNNVMSGMKGRDGIKGGIIPLLGSRAGFLLPSDFYGNAARRELRRARLIRELFVLIKEQHFFAGRQAGGRRLCSFSLCAPASKSRDLPQSDRRIRPRSEEELMQWDLFRLTIQPEDSELERPLYDPGR